MSSSPSSFLNCNPAHPGLQFKKLEGEDDIYSARIGLEYRALAIVKKDRIVWYGSAITPNTTVWSDPLANCAHPIQCASPTPPPRPARLVPPPPPRPRQHATLSSTPTPATEPQLRRELGLRDLVLFNIAAVGVRWRCLE